MNAGILLILFILIRYALLFLFGGGAFRRAAHYPPFPGAEKAALIVYQTASLLLFVSLLFLKVQTGTSWFGWGLAVYFAGSMLLAVSTIKFRTAWAWRDEPERPVPDFP